MVSDNPGGYGHVKSVDINGAGNRVIIRTSYYEDGMEKVNVKVYEYQSSTSSWQIIGGTKAPQ